jgi:hypothetical protein
MTAGSTIGAMGFFLYGWFFAGARTVGNGRSWLRLRDLPAPRRDEVVNTPFLEPLDPGPSLWRRPGMGRLILAMVAAVVVVALVVSYGAWRASG